MPVVRQQADLMVNDVQYRVATVACGEPASEVGAEVVESLLPITAFGHQMDWSLARMFRLILQVHVNPITK